MCLSVCLPNLMIASGRVTPTPPYIHLPTLRCAPERYLCILETSLNREKISIKFYGRISYSHCGMQHFPYYLYTSSAFLNVLCYLCGMKTHFDSHHITEFLHSQFAFSEQACTSTHFYRVSVIITNYALTVTHTHVQTNIQICF